MAWPAITLRLNNDPALLLCRREETSPEPLIAGQDALTDSVLVLVSSAGGLVVLPHLLWTPFLPIMLFSFSVMI